MRRFALLAPGLFSLGLLALGGCADKTAILLEVRSDDLSVPADVDTLEIRAEHYLGATFEQSFAIGGTWPHTLTIRPAPGETSGRVDITVTGRRSGAFVVRRVVSAVFAAGQTRRVEIVLPRSCVGVMCTDGVDCQAGMCMTTPMTDGGVPDAGMDAGTDAGSDDGGAEDSGTEDAGDLDAGPGDSGPGDAGGSDAGPPPRTLVINEIDYDQVGTDSAEYVEILNVSADPVSLMGVELMMVNGSGGTPYTRVTLSGTLAPGAYAVVTVAGVVLPTDTLRFPFLAAMDNAQNGAPDGVALVDTIGGRVIDALSYEGSITSAMLPGIATPVSLVEGGASPAAVDSNTVPGALCRMPNGTDTDVASLDWALCGTLTPGAPNAM